MPGTALRSARRNVRSEHSHFPSFIIMVQALTLSTGTAVLARRRVKVQARRGKAVVARCGKSRANRVDIAGNPRFPRADRPATSRLTDPSRPSLGSVRRETGCGRL